MLDSYQNPHRRSPLTYFTCGVNFETKMDERLQVVFANNVIYLDNYYKQLYYHNLNMYNNTLFPLLRHSTSFPHFLQCEVTYDSLYVINPLNPELNPICYLLALLGAHYFLHVSRIRVKSLTLRRLMSYIYGAPILDVSRSHTTTQHSL